MGYVNEPKGRWGEIGYTAAREACGGFDPTGRWMRTWATLDEKPEGARDRLLWSAAGEAVALAVLQPIVQVASSSGVELARDEASDPSAVMAALERVLAKDLLSPIIKATHRYGGALAPDHGVDPSAVWEAVESLCEKLLSQRDQARFEADGLREERADLRFSTGELLRERDELLRERDELREKLKGALKPIVKVLMARGGTVLTLEASDPETLASELATMLDLAGANLGGES